MTAWPSARREPGLICPTRSGRPYSAATCGNSWRNFRCDDFRAFHPLSRAVEQLQLRLPVLPVAKHFETPDELQADKDSLERFVRWVEKSELARISIFFTPWGEAADSQVVPAGDRVAHAPAECAKSGDSDESFLLAGVVGIDGSGETRHMGHISSRRDLTRAIRRQVQGTDGSRRAALRLALSVSRNIAARSKCSAVNCRPARISGSMPITPPGLLFE